MQEFIVNSIKRAHIPSDVVDFCLEAGIMIKSLQKKYPEIEHAIGITKKEMQGLCFPKDKFKQLLHFYMKEKTQ